MSTKTAWKIGDLFGWRGMKSYTTDNEWYKIEAGDQLTILHSGQVIAYAAADITYSLNQRMSIVVRCPTQQLLLVPHKIWLKFLK